MREEKESQNDSDRPERTELQSMEPGQAGRGGDFREQVASLSLRMAVRRPLELVRRQVDSEVESQQAIRASITNLGSPGYN